MQGHKVTIRLQDWFARTASSKQSLVRGRVLLSASRDVMATLDSWLPSRDSNPDQRLQRPVCYRYTTRQ